MDAGSIQTDAAGLYRTPSFLVMYLFRSHSRPLPLRLAADFPVRMDATACASEDRTSVTVFAVNPRSEPVRLALDLADFGPGFEVKGGEIVKDARDGRQTDIINSFADPRRVIKTARPSPRSIAAENDVRLAESRPPRSFERDLPSRPVFPIVEKRQPGPGPRP